MLLRENETEENLDDLFQEFQDAHNMRKDRLAKLREEIKIIKKLKV